MDLYDLYTESAAKVCVPEDRKFVWVEERVMDHTEEDERALAREEKRREAELEEKRREAELEEKRREAELDLEEKRRERLS